MSLLIRPQAFSTDVDRIFNTLMGADEPNGRRWYPPMDLVEEQDRFVLKADLPGLGSQDVSIEVSDGVLRISGERSDDRTEKGRGWYRVERTFGKFSRSLNLPEGVDAEHISASFDQGVLEVAIPKPEERQPTRIEIKAGANEAKERPPVIEGAVNEN